MLNRERKEALVADLKEKIESANAIFLTNLIGIPSNDSNEIRKQVRDANGTIVITRNTLIERASKGTPAEEMLSGLKGPNAVAIAFEDAPAVAKAIYEAGKENELIKLGKGILKGKALDESEIETLAKLPGKDQMLATVLATMNAPVSAFARVLFAINEKKAEGAPVEAAPTETAEVAETTENTEENKGE